MRGQARTLEVPAVSSKEAFAEIDARLEAEALHIEPSGVAAAGPFSEFEVQARELEVSARRHRDIALSLDRLANRIRETEEAPFNS